MSSCRFNVHLVFGVLAGLANIALAADPGQMSFKLSPHSEDGNTGPRKHGHLRARPGDEEPAPLHEVGFRELGSLFNVREANPDVHKGEWLVELQTGWQTRSDGSDDDVALTGAIAYGITDDLMVKLEVLPLNFGDAGGQGNGDLSLAVFYRWIKESDTIPAIASWADLRVPSGDGSSGVDASFNLGLTKSLSDRLRLHANGMVETLNGARGDEGGFDRTGNTRRERAREHFRERLPLEIPAAMERVLGVREFMELFEREPGRRSFRWELGMGVDYLLTDTTLGVLNYVHGSNEEEGLRNQHILEMGVAQVVAEHQALRLAIDIGLTGAEDTPNLAVKLQYVIAF